MKLYIKQINEPAESLRKCLLGFVVQSINPNTASQLFATRNDAIAELDQRIGNGDSLANDSDIRVFELGC